MASVSFDEGSSGADLPPYLLSSWRLDPLDESNSGRQLRGFTTSSISKALIETQLSLYEATQRKRETKSTPSLSSLAVSKVLQSLFASDFDERDAKTILESLGTTNLKQLLNDPSLTYLQFRRLYDYLSSNSSFDCEKEIDIDNVILRNERHIRSRGRDTNQDGYYLLHLKDLPRLLPGHTLRSRGYLGVPAMPPVGGLETFYLDPDMDWPNKIHGKDRSFAETFERVTNGVLKGMNWNNVLLAGGMVLSTLMHTHPVIDDLPRILNPDLDLYLYGLDPDEANAKVEHIHQVWARNLPPWMTDRLIVKNARTITFFTDFPQRRIQIILKLMPSPTDILLNFDLDACALGFNGSQVVMLPRFVRALETGSSMFTMDLIWGHRFGNRAATQETRVCKYADRGFGIRILPSYARSLEHDFCSSAIAGSDVNEWETSEQMGKQHPSTLEQRNRFPQGKEPGLKTLKRIAFLGRDFTHRFAYGLSPLVLLPEDLKAQDACGTASKPDQKLLACWKERVNIAEPNARARLGRGEGGKRARFGMDGLDGDYVEVGRPPLPDRRKLRKLFVCCVNKLMDIWGSDVFIQTDNLSFQGRVPDIRCGLDNFEKFVRHSEAWTMDARGQIDFKDDPSSDFPDEQSYDDPQYQWSREFSIHDHFKEIDQANLEYWSAVKAAICEKVGIPARVGGFSGYAARMLRRRVHGHDVASIMSKQLTIPVVIPADLEYYILQILPSRYPDLPVSFTSTPCLIPLQDPSSPSTNTGIPALQTIAGESGNLRWWIITNESIWEGQHRVVDEVFELLWSLHYWLMEQSSYNTPGGSVSTARPECVQHIARAFRRRCILPEVTDEEELGYGLPSLREAILFRSWALRSPPNLQRDHFYYRTDAHEIFDGDRVRYPFEDELFWESDYEGLRMSQRA